jgi:hypothetical protein
MNVTTCAPPGVHQLLAEPLLMAELANRCGLPAGPDTTPPNGREATGYWTPETETCRGPYHWARGLLAASQALTAIEACERVQGDPQGDLRTTDALPVNQIAGLLHRLLQVGDDLAHAGRFISNHHTLGGDLISAWHDRHSELLARINRCRENLAAATRSKLTFAEAYRLAVDIVFYELASEVYSPRSAGSARLAALAPWFDAGVDYLLEREVRLQVEQQVIDAATPLNQSGRPDSEVRDRSHSWLRDADRRVQDLLSRRRAHETTVIAVTGSQLSGFFDRRYDRGDRSFDKLNPYGATRGAALAVGLPGVVAPGDGTQEAVAVIFAELLVALWFSAQADAHALQRTLFGHTNVLTGNIAGHLISAVDDLPSARLAGQDFVTRWLSGPEWKNPQEVWEISQALCR